MTISRVNIPKQINMGRKVMNCGTKKMKKGGMASCTNKKKNYAKGGKVRGTGCAKRGKTPCKVY